MEIHRNLWNPIKFYGNPWISKEINENPWKYMESMEIHECLNRAWAKIATGVAALT